MSIPALLRSALAASDSDSDDNQGGSIVHDPGKRSDLDMISGLLVEL